MTRSDLTITEQETDYLDYQLLSDTNGDGIAETGINLSAVGTVELWRRDRGGTVDSFSSIGGSPKVVVTAAAAGSVQIRPGTADFIAANAPYSCQWKCYISATRWYYVPEDSEFTISVKKRIG